MKSIVQLAAISALALFALAGCSQNPSDNSTGNQSTNSSLTDTNSLPYVNTNSPAGTN